MFKNLTSSNFQFKFFKKSQNFFLLFIERNSLEWVCKQRRELRLRRIWKTHETIHWQIQVAENLISVQFVKLQLNQNFEFDHNQTTRLKFKYLFYDKAEVCPHIPKNLSLQPLSLRTETFQFDRNNTFPDFDVQYETVSFNTV